MTLNLLLLKLTLWLPVLLSTFNTDSKHDEQHSLDLGFRCCLVEVKVFSADLDTVLSFKSCLHLNTSSTEIHYFHSGVK